MENYIIYNDIKNNKVTLKTINDNSYEVYLNDVLILYTDVQSEAEIVAESIDLSLSILDEYGLLNENE